MALVERKRETSPSPSTPSTRQPKYDVFLSFRGEDTRTNFTDHLYVALKRKGIITFRDEEELKKGERISELFKAIEESQFAIIILSRNYASSTWCLDELAKIIKCQDEKGLKVLPVFYDLSPSVVRKQTESFEQAFIDHQKRFEDDIKKVETWRDTLKKVADIKGWDLHLQNRLESEIIQDIVKVIMEKLSSKFSSINKNLIGIKSMVAELIPSYLGFGNDIYMMGICGMGGLGKTTLASAIYYKYSDHFESSSFIANVRERSEKGELHELQQQLLDEILEGSNTKIYNVQVGVKKIKSSGLRHKKILLVLDDVNHKDQLENLAGEHDWFGLGSWIIITTRDEHVLVDHGVLKIYKPNGLDDDDASKLFCLKAFKNEQPKEGYMQLSQEVVKYANGLPLALVTLGSFLVGRTTGEWQSALENFKKNPKREIYDILKISYDGLDEMWKDIFLDIACFFRRWKKNEVIQILENCSFDARIGISVLVEKSLLTIDEFECFEMHDLLQEMGVKIVHFEQGGKLGKPSRLWLIKDLLPVLENDMATKAIQAIVVCNREEDFNSEEFIEVLSKMSNLKLLIIYMTGYMYESLRRCKRPVVPNGPRQLVVPNKLRHLSWNFCPLKCLSSCSQPKELVELGLRFSQLEYLWEGIMRSVNLKFIDLNHSENLIRTPDFSGVPILEELSLSYCPRLVEIHPSIGQLSKLRYLDLQWCRSITHLPSMSAEMQSLTFLDLTNCVNLECLPRDFNSLRSLEKLILCGCSKLKLLQRLPSSLRYLSAQQCLSLQALPAFNKKIKPSPALFSWGPYDESRSGVAFTILFHYLQELLFRKNVSGTSTKRKEDGQSITEFLIVVSGSEILSRLTHRSVGNSITVELPSNWCNSKWMGFALCASLSLAIVRCWKEFGVRARVIAVGDMPQNHYASELFTRLMFREDGIWLLYLSRDDWFSTVGNSECSQIKVIFETSDPTIHLSECGVNLVYEQDVDEFSQTNAQYLIGSFVGDDEDDDGYYYDAHTVSGGDDDDDDDDDDDYYDAYTVSGDDIESW